MININCACSARGSDHGKIYRRTNFADHLEGTSHDTVNDYLRREKHTARQLWKLAEPLINDRPGGYLIADDSVQDKRHSRVMELVKRQYSGNEHGLVKGIGIVNLVHSDGTDHYPINFRVGSPEIQMITLPYLIDRKPCIVMMNKVPNSANMISQFL